MPDLNLLIEVDCWNGPIKKEWERMHEGGRTPTRDETDHLMKLVAEHLSENPVCGHICMYYYD